MRWQLKINTLIWFAAVFCIGNYLLIWLKLSLGRAFYGILASPILFFSTRYVLTGQNSHLSLISLRKKQRGDLLVFIIIHYYHLMIGTLTSFWTRLDAAHFVSFEFASWRWSKLGKNSTSWSFSWAWRRWLMMSHSLLEKQKNIKDFNKLILYLSQHKHLQTTKLIEFNFVLWISTFTKFPSL